MADIKTKIFNDQLNEEYIKNGRINIANGVAGLDNTAKLSIDIIPVTDVENRFTTASTSAKGITQLSNNYAGSSEALAVTEKALSEGLSSVRTFYTKDYIFKQAAGDITVGQTVIDLSDKWPTTEIYGISVFRDGLYQNISIDFNMNFVSKTVTLTTAVVANETITVVFDCLLNGETFGSAGFYNKSEVDNYLALKANINSPSLTGTPLSITNSTATDATKQIATDEFVQNAFNYYIGKIKITVGNTQPSSPNTGDIWIDTTTA